MTVAMEVAAPFMEKEVYAAVMAATSSVENITLDRIEAVTKGHGMVNIAALCAMNAMTSEILRGRDIRLSDENLPELPVDHVLHVGIDAALEAGAEEVHLAGSGPMLFALTRDDVKAMDIHRRLQKMGLKAHLADF
mgnify:CR=1 FL=1